MRGDVAAMVSAQVRRSFRPLALTGAGILVFVGIALWIAVVV
jgi:hypothetical protein